MAAPNYSFEKRKRELAKKAAKEAKRLRKEAKITDPQPVETIVEPAAELPDTPPIKAEDA